MTGHNLIDVITKDHREVEAVFTELEGRLGTPEHRRDLADHVIAELVRHSVAEEMYMYPAVREHVPGGGEIADHEIEEHAEAERIMKRLEDIPATDPGFETTLNELTGAIRHHVEEEESDLLPKLAAACSREQLEELGEKVIRAKKIAPTRPHPSAPDTPPANMLLAPGAGLIDRLRDKLSGRDV
ncbi:hemerythrin HHE cation binding domain-containing protein [Stackebrandtia albiflava]|uniref:Hemerythrin HHE cation binding domain-containing protein n=1 Tax=Stackebrandtia albiflava TaxID=406432 RepID=A0A562V2R9_9ACTN|nr:hemerythrin domain-containing protein [Stackebrandtia albiflava]TWJ12158.1 hemerythrin HHE cation binding domain-containing protein [Stackebrandtia albiflava]